jgi:alanine racemase
VFSAAKEISMHTSCEINLSNLIHNYRQIRNILRPGTGFMGVVKADAYGHGSVRVAQALQTAGIDCLSVALLEEALRLRQNGITIPILVFGRVPREEYGLAVAHSLDLTVFELETAVGLNEYAKSKNVKQNIYIKIDTGMGRLGMIPDEKCFSDIVRISHLPDLVIKGVYSHFSVADTDPVYTEKQFILFENVIDELKNRYVKIPCNHICNSSAALMYPHMHLDMVRIGLALYGLYPSDDIRNKCGVDLKEVMSIKTRISLIKEIKEPSYISYGNTYKAMPGEIICTLPVGYADGIPRLLSNNFDVLIKNKRCKAVGTVCMDYFMVSCDDMPDYDDEVVLIGRQGGESISIDETAFKSDTINYEIITRMGQRFSRSYVYE